MLRTRPGWATCNDSSRTIRTFGTCAEGSSMRTSAIRGLLSAKTYFVKKTRCRKLSWIVRSIRDIRCQCAGFDAGFPVKVSLRDCDFAPCHFQSLNVAGPDPCVYWRVLRVPAAYRLVHEPQRR